LGFGAKPQERWVAENRRFGAREETSSLLNIHITYFDLIKK